MTIEIYPDATPQNRDWVRKTWTLPPYKSPEFLAFFPDLAAVRKTPLYRRAVQDGLIVKDEWVGKE